MAALGDITEADQAATRQLATGHELADDELIALAHNLLGMVAWARGDPRALEHHAAALRHARWADELWPLVLITALAGRAAHATGDHDRGDGLLAEAIRLAEQLGEPMVLGSALGYQAHAAFAAGSQEQAANLTATTNAATTRQRSKPSPLELSSDAAAALRCHPNSLNPCADSIAWRPSASARLEPQNRELAADGPVVNVAAIEGEAHEARQAPSWMLALGWASRLRYQSEPGPNPDTTVTAPLARSRAATSTTTCRTRPDARPMWLIRTNRWPSSQPSLARYSQTGSRYSSRRAPAGRRGRFMISTRTS